jgi:hypothetical protein
MASSQSSFERLISYKEAFLASLCRSISTPSETWPTVRLWKKGPLNQLFKSVHEQLSKSKPPLTNIALLDWLKKLGLIWPVEAENETFHLLEMGANSQSEIDPLELMMAYEPTGVVCYFSALAFHSLTSQIPSQHHVAVLEEPALSDKLVQGSSSNEQVEEKEHGGMAELAARPANESAPRSQPNPLGKNVFSYFEIPYYLTRRKMRLVPGVQTRSNGPRGRFRITTYEQTLLDTLHKPQSCGGPAIVLEAWQEAVDAGVLNEEKLVDYLISMDYPPTSRRVGAMFQLFGCIPAGRLHNYLHQVQQGIKRNSPYTEVSLLPGFEYSNLDPTWLVRMP